MGVESKLVPKLLAVEPPELAGDELEVLGDEGECLDLRNGLDGAGGRREDDARTRVEGPRQELLAAEVARTYAAGVEEPSPTAVGGVGVEVAPYNE